MSLIVWIPFVNGNCQNQGLLGVETSTLGTITYEDGKLGKAVRIGTGSQVSNGIFINSNLLDELGDEYSCAVWIKPTGNHVHYEGAILSSGNWNTKRWAFGVNQTNTAVDMFGPSYNRNLACEITVNEWTHLVSTFKNNVGTLYKNGEYVGTYTFNQSGDVNGLQSDAANTTVGRETYASGYFGFNGCIQDLRVYNHCLSPREAKELSKGLVLHYPLSGIGKENLVDTTKTFPVGGTGRMQNIENGVKTLGVDADTYFNIPLKTALASGTTYTLSFHATDVPDGSRLTFGLGAQSTSHASHCGIVDVHGGYNTFTFTPGANFSTQIIMDDIYRTGLPIVEMTYFKIEEGDAATPWIPSSNDSRYTAVGSDENIIHDTSGYKYNGTIINGGISYSGDTPRYQISTEFDGITGAIRVPFNDFVTNGDIFTLNLWWKKKELGSKNYETLFGGPSGFEMDTRSGGASTLSLYMASTRGGNVFSPFNFNQWYMVTLVNDGTNELYYVNGELKKTIEKKAMPTGVYRIGAWASDTGQNYKGLISDFRIYKTALSADDILELYHTPITLSNNGTLMTQGEYVEV